MRKAAWIVAAAIVAAALYWRASGPVEVEDRRAEAACLAAYSVVRTPALVPEPEPEDDVQQSAPECTTVVPPAPPPRTPDSGKLILTRDLTYVCFPCLRLGTIQCPLDKPIPPCAKCKVCGGSMYRDPIEEDAIPEDERFPRRLHQERRRRACRT